MPEPTKPGQPMEDDRLAELASRVAVGPDQFERQAEWDELVAEIRRLRQGEVLLMMVDGHASRRLVGYVESPLAKRTKAWLYP